MKDTWQAWQTELCECHECDLSLTRTHVVCGSGNRAAKIMLVGEAPGKQEDLSGQPFCGAAGQKLQKFLEQLRLSKEDIYIGNVVKCRPVKPSVRGFSNRTPNKKELSACQLWFERELKLLNPQLIITLGAVPLSVFLGKKPKMQDYHGQPFEHKEVSATVFPLYHPAAVIYDRRKEEAYQKDLQKLTDFLLTEKYILGG